jgi:hypothetical protein
MALQSAAAGVHGRLIGGAGRLMVVFVLVHDQRSFGLTVCR